MKKRACSDVKKPKKNPSNKPLKIKQIIKSRTEAQRKMKRKISHGNSLKSKRNEIHDWLKISSSRFFFEEEEHTRKIAFTKIKEA